MTSTISQLTWPNITTAMRELEQLLCKILGNFPKEQQAIMLLQLDLETMRRIKNTQQERQRLLLS